MLTPTPRTDVVPTPGNGASDRIVAALDRLEQRLARLEAAVDRLEGLERRLPDALAMATDTVDSLIARARDAGFDVDERMRALLRAADRLTSPAAIDALDATLTSGLLEAHAVAVLGKLGRALATSGSVEPEKVGALGLFKALRDPHVQRALGFGLRLAREFGQALEGHALLDDPGAPRALPARTGT